MDFANKAKLVEQNNWENRAEVLRSPDLLLKQIVCWLAVHLGKGAERGLQHDNKGSTLSFLGSSQSEKDFESSKHKLS